MHSNDLDHAIATMSEIDRTDAMQYAMRHSNDMKQLKKDLRLVRLGLTYLWQAVFGVDSVANDGTVVHAGSKEDDILN